MEVVYKPVDNFQFFSNQYHFITETQRNDIFSVKQINLMIFSVILYESEELSYRL